MMDHIGHKSIGRSTLDEHVADAARRLRAWRDFWTAESRKFSHHEVSGGCMQATYALGNLTGDRKTVFFNPCDTQEQTIRDSFTSYLMELSERKGYSFIAPL